MNLLTEIKNVLFIVSLIIALSACENGSFNETSSTEIIVNVGDTVSVFAGDKLVPDDEYTLIDVVHVLEDNRKTVTILAGRATLIRGAYAVAN